MQTQPQGEAPGIKRPREALPCASLVEVTGAGAAWLNQKYVLRNVEAVRDLVGESWARWDISHKGKKVYIGSAASPKGAGSLPYIWYDWKHRQWKIATIGFASSHYLCRIQASGTFPEGAKNWKPGPKPATEDLLFPESARCCARQIRVEVLERTPASDAVADSSPKHRTGAWSGHVSDVAPAPEAKLTFTQAQDFLRDGFVVVTASEVHTTACAKAVLRAANIAIRDILDSRTADGFQVLRDLVVCDSNPAWPVYDRLMHPGSSLWGLLCEITGCPLQRPQRCQLAILFPEGRPEDQYTSHEDGRPQVDYHIDGRGKIPNGFTLLVGVALNDQPADCSSWGGLTVFPGSHLRSDLHKLYPAQKRGDGHARLDLGSSRQLRLNQGDVVIAHSLLAHRSSENWSEVTRCMAYFRLRPLQRSSTWEDGVVENPLANVPGVVARARIDGALAKLGQSAA